MIHHGYQLLGWGPRLKGKELSTHVYPALLLGYAHSVTRCLLDMASAAMATLKDGLSLRTMNQNKLFLLSVALVRDFLASARTNGHTIVCIFCIVSTGILLQSLSDFVLGETHSRLAGGILSSHSVQW